MTNSIENRLLSILRDQSKLGNDRVIPFDEPLSHVGLDSLALLNFLTAVEKEFGLELPDELWTHKDNMTIRRFGSLVREHGDPLPSAPGSPPTSRTSSVTPGKSNGADSVVTYFILARDLHSGDLPTAHPVVPLRFAEASTGDVPSLAGFWPPEKQTRKEQRFLERLQAGYTGLAAWREKELVGIDWISPRGDFEPNTGLQIETSPGTAYGFDLYEKHEGLGAGFALLCLSLEECKRRGFSRQVTLVSEQNVRMMTVATNLAGYDVAGKIETHRSGSTLASFWTVNGKEGHGGTILV